MLFVIPSLKERYLHAAGTGIINIDVSHLIG